MGKFNGQIYKFTQAPSSVNAAKIFSKFSCMTDGALSYWRWLVNCVSFIEQKFRHPSSEEVRYVR